MPWESLDPPMKALLCTCIVIISYISTILANHTAYISIIIRLYIYIYTLGAGGSPGTPAPWVLIYMKLRVGWGGDDNVPCTCTHGRCYATSCSLHLANLVDATQVLGWGGVGMITFLALAHMVGASSCCKCRGCSKFERSESYTASVFTFEHDSQKGFGARWIEVA